MKVQSNNFLNEKRKNMKRKAYNSYVIYVLGLHKKTQLQTIGTKVTNSC